MRKKRASHNAAVDSSSFTICCIHFSVSQSVCSRHQLVLPFDHSERVMTASVGLRHLFCRRQDLCCGLQVKKKKSFKFISCIREPFVLDSRRQESAAGSTGNVNVQILEAPRTSGGLTGQVYATSCLFHPTMRSF